MFHTSYDETASAHVQCAQQVSLTVLITGCGRDTAAAEFICHENNIYYCYYHINGEIKIYNK